jgi:hypothetical protein
MSFTSPDSRETVSEPAKQALTASEELVGALADGTATEVLYEMYALLLKLLMQLPISFFVADSRLLQAPSL